MINRVAEYVADDAGEPSLPPDPATKEISRNSQAVGYAARACMI